VNAVNTVAGTKSLNSSALISLGGFLLFNVGPYTGLNGKKLVLSINNGPDVEVTFSGTSISAKSLVAQVNDTFSTNEVTEAYGELMPDGLSASVRTVGAGEFQTLAIVSGTDPEVLAVISENNVVGYVLPGTSVYTQTKVSIPFSSFPDPNNNLSQLSFEQNSIRAFVSTGAGVNLREFLPKESFLRKGGSGVAASTTGTTALSTVGLYGGGGTLNGTSLTLTFESATSPQYTVTFASPADANAVLQQINAAVGAMVATNNTGLKITSQVAGASSRVRVGGTAAALFGFTGAALDVSGEAAIQVVDDGNGDGYSPLVEFNGVDFTTAGSAAVATGAYDISGLSYPADVVGLTLELSVSGMTPQTWTVPSVANQGAFLSAFNAFFTGVTASVASNRFVLTTAATGEEGTISIIGGTLLPVMGLVPRIVGSVNLANVSPDLTALNTRKLKVTSSSGSVEVTFSGLSGTTPSTVSAFLNAQPAFAALFVASIDTGGYLCVRSILGGNIGSTAVSLTIDAASSLESATYLGFTPGTSATYNRKEGSGFPPVSGDELYVDGNLVGRITKVAPGGDVSRLRINKQERITSDYGDKFWIQARNLTAGAPSRPTAELTFNTRNMPVLKHDVLRDTNGNVLLGSAAIYLQYTAIRKDVTALAETPTLISFESTTELETNLSPVDSTNPLALGLYFALLNAPGCSVVGAGVDEVSADYPEGTVEAWARAAELLEAYEVYAIAPLTNEEEVAQLMSTHVTAMSEPAMRGERVVLFNPAEPSKKLDKLIASGVGNSVGVSGLQFDTGVMGLSTFLLAEGVDPVGTIPVSDGVFLDIVSDAKRYSVSQVSGSIVTIRTSFLAGENDDGYYATSDLNDSPLPSSLISETFAIRIKGASLLTATGNPDKEGIAETYNALGLSRMNRRVRHIIASACAASVGGVTQRLPGYYLCAARVGMMAQQPPQQSMTNFPMTGLTKVYGTNGYFNERQLDIIAGGGNDIIVQDVANGPLTSRMALTTDTTSIEARTDNVNAEIDFTAKFMRRTLRIFIGRFNITQGLLDSLGHVVQGVANFLVDLGVLNGLFLDELIQDENAQDSVILETTADPNFPCNYIKAAIAI
jgi:hypothetical protein